MSPKAVVKYEANEKVLCYHGSMIYEAKIRDVDPSDKQGKYLVHYMGWNNKWDEWVNEGRIMKYNDENKTLAKEVNSQTTSGSGRRVVVPTRKQKPSETRESVEKTTERGGEKAATDKSVTDSSVSKKDSESSSKDVASTKRKVAKKRTAPGSGGGIEENHVAHGVTNPRRKRARPGLSVETEEQYLSRREVRLRMPEDLKPYLVDDWDMISRQGKLVALPARVTVAGIMNDYVAYKYQRSALWPKKRDPDDIVPSSDITEAAGGMRLYFDVMLGAQLLYKFERPQYNEILQKFPETPMSEIYGFPHLLRLFVKMGEMLAYTPLDERSINLILTHVYDMMKYLQIRKEDLFSLDNYETAPPEYHRKVAFC